MHVRRQVLSCPDRANDSRALKQRIRAACGFIVFLGLTCDILRVLISSQPSFETGGPLAGEHSLEEASRSQLVICLWEAVAAHRVCPPSVFGIGLLQLGRGHGQA